MKKLVTTLALLFLLVGCSTASTPTEITTQPLPSSTAVAFPQSSTQDQSTPTFIVTSMTPALPSDTAEPSWQDLPIIPDVSSEMIEVYQRGLERGNDPARFSKIGDCQNITTYFLAMFDSGSYALGDQYDYLQPTIDHFSGSWKRQSLAVKGGMNAAAVQNVLWANPEACKSGETPLQCELRVYKPSIALISMEESWAGSTANYDFYMRKIVEYVLAQDIVPILATRAETPTQERQINAIIAQIAEDYSVPLWNFWAATSTLSNYGLSDDGFHLSGKDSTPDQRSHFDFPENLQLGWTQRNLTALQAIDAVYRALSGN